MESNVTETCPECLDPVESMIMDYLMNGTENESYYDPRMTLSLQTSIAGILYKYVTPTDVFVGLVANMVSILVFAGKELRKLSSSVYVLSVLSADTGLLLTILFVWLETLGYNIYHRTGLCQFYVYFQFVCSFLSVWYMVCITVENYITICHPLKIRSLCTLSRARIVVLSLLLASLLIYVFSVFSSHVAHTPYAASGKFCQTKPDWNKFSSIMSYVDTVLTLLLPSLAILFMLVAIVVAIVTSLRKKRKRTVKENQRKTSCPQVRVAKMLFALSFTYLLLNIPSHIIRLYYLMMMTVGKSQEITMNQGFIQLIFQHISYINFYIKFFLFFAFSANFRKGVLGGCCKYLPRCRVYTPVAQTNEGTRV